MKIILKQWILLILWVGFSTSVFSQDNKEVLNVEYQVWSIKQQDFKTPSEEAYLLSIGEDFSAFYRIPPKQYRKIGIKNLTDCYTVYNGYPDGNHLTFLGTILDIPYKYTEPLPKLNWEIQEDDSVVCGYTCQKACATFRGLTWTAWFSVDLPYSVGPWKLCGLPGLILKAYESKGNYCFNAVEIAKGRGTEVKTKLQRAKIVTPKWFAEEMIEYGKNPDQYKDDHGKAFNGTLIVNGVQQTFHTNPWVPNLLEYFDEKK